MTDCSICHHPEHEGRCYHVRTVTRNIDGWLFDDIVGTCLCGTADQVLRETGLTLPSEPLP